MKVIGASRLSVGVQVFSETFLFFSLSMLLATLLIGISTPGIFSYTGIQFNPQLIYSPEFLAISIAGTFILSLIFSLIPALRISSSKTMSNPKKSIEPNARRSVSSGILVTAQFTIAIVLIAFTILVQKQVNFGSNDLGINKENILGIKLSPELMAKKDVLKKILSEKPTVEKFSFAQYFPGELISHWESQVDIAGEKKQLSYDTFNADARFFNTIGLKLTMGRLYSEDFSTDGNKVVVNESFVRENNLLNPIGIKLTGMTGNIFEIIGVVKDFHYKPINKQILPLVIRNEQFASYCLVNLQAGNYNLLDKSIQDIKATTANLSPSFPVEISFLDQAIGKMYESELLFRRTFSLFAGCAIVICCMGILAMSLFACQRRIKEIGIRKVNGARITEVMTMLNRDFVKWVAIAFIIATPIAHYIMNRWLENFAYKTTLSWWIFALSGFSALAIALLTVSWQSWRAATRNPVEALRDE
jgi:putative ABC transport system permease protein